MPTPPTRYNHRMRFRHRLTPLVAVIAVGLAGCSGGNQAGHTDAAATGSGGASNPPGSGGTTASGGSKGSGGVTASGGSKGSGGVVGSGGVTATGGKGSGGGVGSGGVTATGGKGSGGVVGSGGVTATGGKSSGGSGPGGRSGSGGASGGAGAGGVTGAGGAAGSGWVLSWSDEFDGASGTKPDATKWTYDLGMTGWGNNELEDYTSDAANASTDGNGNLAITVIAQGTNYTSARLKTEGLFSQAYGRFEARIQLPRGQGIWPAFWALGADIDKNPWPACGEIDIMENIGKEPSINHGSMHGPGYSGSNPLTGTYQLPSGALADDFHLYAIEWETNVVRFYVDDNLYETRKNTDVPWGATWVFDHPFFLILDVAVGGSFPGNPDSTTTFPQKMLVDYVRVYQRTM